MSVFKGPDFEMEKLLKQQNEKSYKHDFYSNSIDPEPV